MSQKQQEVQQLSQDLLEQRAETAALRRSLEGKELVKPTLQPFSNSSLKWQSDFNSFFFSSQEGTKVSSSLTALQAERDVLQRSVLEKTAELSALKSQAQLQQGSLDLEKERLTRELEALRAQLQQQVQNHPSHRFQFTDDC